MALSGRPSDGKRKGGFELRKMNKEKRPQRDQRGGARCPSFLPCARMERGRLAQRSAFKRIIRMALSTLRKGKHSRENSLRRPHARDETRVDIRRASDQT